MTSSTTTPLSQMTPAQRQALFSAATPTINMPDRKADRSRNNMRTPRSVKRRAIR